MHTDLDVIPENKELRFERDLKLLREIQKMTCSKRTRSYSAAEACSSTFKQKFAQLKSLLRMNDVPNK